MNCKETCIRLFLLLLSIAFGLLVGEVAVRLFVPASAQEYSGSATADQYTFYRYDDLLGWSNAPGTQGIHKKEEFEYPVSINAYGMRQKEVDLDKKTGVFRIAFLGDSMTWAVGVPDEQRFTDIIGSLPNVESLNFSVTGYGPVQYLILVDKIIPFKPDLVVISFCLSNDFGDSVLYQAKNGYYKPYCVIDQKGELKIQGYPIRNIKKFGRQRTHYNGIVLRHSRLAQLILDKVTRKLAASRWGNAGLLGYDDQLIYDFPNISRKEMNLVDQSVLINKKILEAIKEKLQAKMIPLVIITAPTRFEYSGRAEANINVLDRLSKNTSELGIDLINTVPVFNINDFWPAEGHWNASGHKKMAIAIKDYLKRKGFIKLRADAVAA